MMRESIEFQLDQLERKVEALKRNSHPPVAFEECPLCHCVVFADSAKEHRRKCPSRPRQ